MRILPTLALSAAIAVAGCQHPDGSTDWAGTAVLGAGIGAAAGLIAAAATDDGGGHRRYAGNYGHRHAPRWAGNPRHGW